MTTCGGAIHVYDCHKPLTKLFEYLTKHIKISFPNYIFSCTNNFCTFVAVKHMFIKSINLIKLKSVIYYVQLFIYIFKS